MKTRFSHWLRWAIICGAVAAGLVVLFRFDPSRHGFYPPCLFHSLTGLHCPGCGSSRALHQLVHGHIGAAFALNPLLVVMLPFLLYALVQMIGRNNGQPGGNLLSKPLVAWMIAFVVIAFGILRNIPVEPFTRLVP